jgi:hypothetical protein
MMPEILGYVPCDNKHKALNETDVDMSGEDITLLNRILLSKRNSHYRKNRPSHIHVYGNFRYKTEDDLQKIFSLVLTRAGVRHKKEYNIRGKRVDFAITPYKKSDVVTGFIEMKLPPAFEHGIGQLLNYANLYARGHKDRHNSSWCRPTLWLVAPDLPLEIVEVCNQVDIFTVSLLQSAPPQAHVGDQYDHSHGIRAVIDFEDFDDLEITMQAVKEVMKRKHGNP